MWLLLLACASTPPRAPADAASPADAAALPAASPGKLRFGAAPQDPLSDAPSPEVLARGLQVRTGTRIDATGTHPLTFRRIELPDTFGAIVDAAGHPIGRTCQNADFNGFFDAPEGLVMLTQFECGPGVLYRSVLDAGLRVTRSAPVDFAAVGGGFQHCAGSPTPWGTLLSAEEYEPDAARVYALLDRTPAPTPADWPAELTWHQYSQTGDYHGRAAPIPPYGVGWMPEVSPKGEVALHRAMGRFSHELGVVLPDRRTVYLTDDAGFGGLYRFVADTAGDLSAGTLYALKLDGDPASLERAVRWIDLGHAADADIPTDVRFDALFDRAAADPACAAGWTRVENNGAPECLRLRPGMDTLASRLETRRYAELRGATVEFSKEEGAAYDTAHNALYVTVTAWKKGMGATPGARVDDVRWPDNPCGAVLALALDDTYAATSLRPLLVGQPTTEAGVATCAGLSNPDNLAMLEPDDVARGGAAGTLLIAEDTDLRPNPRLWAVDLDVPAGQPLEPVAVLVGPLGSEVTGIHAWRAAGRRFLGVTLQHVGSPEELASMPVAYRTVAQETGFGSWLGVIPLDGAAW